jgi:hypothetical protein
MAKVYLCVTIGSKLFDQIEKERGITKRSTFVEYLLHLGFKTHKNGKTTEATALGRRNGTEKTFRFKEWKP